MRSSACFETVSPVPDHRSDGSKMTWADALMSGFAMFSLTCPSLLDYDKQRADANLQNHLRHSVPALRLFYARGARSACNPSRFGHRSRGLSTTARGKRWKRWSFSQAVILLASRCTGYFSSKKIHRSVVSEKHHRDGSTTYAHQMLGARSFIPIA